MHTSELKQSMPSLLQYDKPCFATGLWQVLRHLDACCPFYLPSPHIPAIHALIFSSPYVLWTFEGNCDCKVGYFRGKRKGSGNVLLHCEIVLVQNILENSKD